MTSERYVPSARQLATLLNVSHTRVNTLIGEGRITRTAQGFDVEAVRAKLAGSLDPTKPTRINTARMSGGPPPESHEELPTRSRGNAYEEYNLARAYKEKLKAKDTELDLKERMGELVELAPINAWAAGMIIKAREEFGRIAPELRDKLAQETDPVNCEEIVAKRINRILSELSEYRANA